jgi:hypothetical protein
MIGGGRGGTPQMTAFLALHGHDDDGSALFWRENIRSPLLFWRQRIESRAISRASCAEGAKLLCLPLDLFSWIEMADWVTYGSSDVRLRKSDEPRPRPHMCRIWSRA